MSRSPLYCPSCERPGAARADLGFIADDGTTGRVVGIACRACGYIAADPGAAYIPDDHTVMLPSGTTAIEWFIERLRALGCDPRPRP